MLNNCNFGSLNKNDLQGGDLYLSTVTSAENHIGGGKLRFVNGSCATLCSNEGGEGYLKSFTSKANQLRGGSYAQLMSRASLYTIFMKEVAD